MTIHSAQDVTSAIESELEYQVGKWGDTETHPHEVGAWILLMQNKLDKAKATWCSQNNDRDALDEIRKVMALGYSCGMQHGMPRRPFKFADRQRNDIQDTDTTISWKKIDSWSSFDESKTNS